MIKLIIILFILLQVLTLSAFAMSDSLKTVDSTSPEKCLVVLLDGTEYFGGIIYQNADSIKIKTQDNSIVNLPTQKLSCIINLKDKYNPNEENVTINYMFLLNNNTYDFGQIKSFDGIYYDVKLDNNTEVKIDSYNFSSNNFPSYLIKSINWYNNSGSKTYRIFLEDNNHLDCQIISANTKNLKLISKSKYLVSLPWVIFNWKVLLDNIADTSELKTVPHLIVLKTGNEIAGKIISNSKDSLLIKVAPGEALKILNYEIDHIYPNNYYARNIVYFDTGYLFSIGYLSANYEYMINRVISLRLNAGTNFILYNYESHSDNMGTAIMLNFLPGGKFSKFEFGFGASYFNKKNRFLPSNNNSSLTTAFTIGYRYQNMYEGLLFRIGMSYLGYSGGLNMSLGYAF